MQPKVKGTFAYHIRSGRLFFGIVIGVVLGVLLLGAGLIKTFQTNQGIRNSAAVYSTKNEKFIDYFTGSNGDTFPRFHIQYTYIVNGQSLTQTQDVSREYYDQFDISQKMIVYYDKNQPTMTLIDLDGKYREGRTNMIYGSTFILLSILLSMLFYRQIFVRR